MATSYCHNKLITLLATQSGKLNRLYGGKTRELAKALQGFKLIDTNNVWRGNKAIEKNVVKILKSLDEDVRAMVLKSALEGVNLSNSCQDAVVDTYLKKAGVSKALHPEYYQRNLSALEGFISYRLNGMDLSDRVWNVSKQSKEQIELLLREGLVDGRPAAKLATDLKQFLKEPNRRFRRVKDANGKLVLSNPAKNYHPGVGVYRSSYKNALRLARNEINIAYRESDHMRRQQIDFVVGIEVLLSNAHRVFDICDSMVGRYPKEFRFVGWHPNCLCWTKAILLPLKEFKKGVYTKNFDARYRIRSIPKAAGDYLNSHSAQIKGWKNRPYFITDNFKNTKDGFALKKGALPKPKK